MDSAIKLFGKTIPLTENGDKHETADAFVSTTQNDHKDVHISKNFEKGQSCLPEEQCDQNSTGTLSGYKQGDLNNPSEGNSQVVDRIADEDQKETDVAGSEKVLKKPDKIFPCPRCNSLDTKFCYYNNYNVNQPRHFCKNCQRYWTAGGTMRNVPVGAGRRKNKHTASHYRHMVMSSDRTASCKLDSSDVHHQILHCGLTTTSRPLQDNGTVLKFGPDAPFCESMSSVLNLGEHKTGELLSVTGSETSREASAGSSATSSSFKKDQSGQLGKLDISAIPSLCNGVLPPQHLQCYGAPPWTWLPSWSSLAASGANRCSSELVYGSDTGSMNSIHWNMSPMMAPPAFCGTSIPYQMMASPSSYWNCLPGWTGGSWNAPLVTTTSVGISPTSSGNSGCSGNDSPLGKHARDGASSIDEKPEKSLWVPKILRVDDPDEAAKSSIWVTLGIKPNQDNSLHKDAILKAFRAKEKEQHQTMDASHVLHATPMPFSHSVPFQGNST